MRLGLLPTIGLLAVLLWLSGLMLDSLASAERGSWNPKASSETAGDSLATTEEEKAPGFALRFGDEASPYALMSAMVQPGETVEVILETTGTEGDYEATFGGAPLEAERTGQWSLEMPDHSGLVDFEVTETVSEQSAMIRFFVLLPYRGEERLGEFEIGSYEARPLRDLPNYRMPDGFIEVNSPRDLVPVSNNFHLSQFVSKQRGDFPKYLRVSSRLLLKLERLLQEARDHGVEADSFVVMSGFRTPAYNLRIGNTTKYSRHLYGDAADLYVDEDGDGLMDDLNGDGRLDVGDAEFLAEIFEEVREEDWYAPYIGGLGIYGPRPHRGAFVHVDTRGYAARWASP